MRLDDKELQAHNIQGILESAASQIHDILREKNTIKDKTMYSALIIAGFFTSQTPRFLNAIGEMIQEAVSGYYNREGRSSLNREPSFHVERNTTMLNEISTTLITHSSSLVLSAGLLIVSIIFTCRLYNIINKRFKDARDLRLIISQDIHFLKVANKYIEKMNEGEKLYDSSFVRDIIDTHIGNLKSIQDELKNGCVEREKIENILFEMQRNIDVIIPRELNRFLINANNQHATKTMENLLSYSSAGDLSQSFMRPYVNLEKVDDNKEESVSGKLSYSPNEDKEDSKYVKKHQETKKIDRYENREYFS
jgi:hypothetical protein